MVGDFQISDEEMVESVKKEWQDVTVEGNPSEHPSAGNIRPEQPFYVKQVEGQKGIEFYLLITEKFIDQPFKHIDQRDFLLDNIFSYLINLKTSSLLKSEANSFSIYDPWFPFASYSSSNEFSLDLLMSTFAIVSPSSTSSYMEWEEVFQISLFVLYQIAQKGPEDAILLQLFTLFSSYYSNLKDFSGLIDSTTLINDILGDANPNGIYNDASQNYNLLKKCKQFHKVFLLISNVIKRYGFRTS